jgi:Uma2 family endonuclease
MVNLARPTEILPNEAIATNCWVLASWETFLAASQTVMEGPCYYDIDRMRLETMPVGFAHGRDNSIVSAVITLYATMRNIPFTALTNTSFRRVGLQECQPDLAYYLQPPLPEIPRSNAPVSIDQYGPPDLVIEIASTTLSDDLGEKRLLYERLGVGEYWVVNVAEAKAVALSVANRGSVQIETSQVLAGLSMNLVEEALRRGQGGDDRAVMKWLLQELQ